MESHSLLVDERKDSLNEDESKERVTLEFVTTMVQIYAEMAAVQFKEAERLMAQALAAKAQGDIILARAADLVSEELPDDLW